MSRHRSSNKLLPAEAARLVSAIQTYWHNRGHSHVTAWCEPFVADDLDGEDCDGFALGQGKELVVVRSNLVRGLPPKK
jgi:hypothetical protein